MWYCQILFVSDPAMILSNYHIKMRHSQIFGGH